MDVGGEINSGADTVLIVELPWVDVTNLFTFIGWLGLLVGLLQMFVS